MRDRFRIASKFMRVGRIDRRRRWLLFEAALWLGVARTSVLVVPFRYLARGIGQVTAPKDGLAAARPPAPPATEVELVRDIGWAVTRAARHVPFTAVCLPQALAAKMMLRRRKLSGVLYFGAGLQAEGQMEAHAWVMAAGVEVTGYPEAHSFTPITCFV